MIVSSRSGLVESNATGAPINSSTRRTYFTACAGNTRLNGNKRHVFDLDAPFFRRSDQPISARVVAPEDGGEQLHQRLTADRRAAIEPGPVAPYEEAEISTDIVEHAPIGRRDALRRVASRARVLHGLRHSLQSVPFPFHCRWSFLSDR